jgi:cold shock CspA family protein
MGVAAKPTDRDPCGAWAGPILCPRQHWRRKWLQVPRSGSTRQRDMGSFSLLAAAGTVFVHISAVERAGLSSLNEGQAVEYEIESNRGKESAINLKIR